MKLERSAGILLHVTSLPSKYGIGDFGPEAFRFVDFLHETRQLLWQILPLTNTEYPSPYSGMSAFAGNPLLISPEKLFDDGLLNEEDLNSVIIDMQETENDHVDFNRVKKLKYQLLTKAYETFKRDQRQQSQLESFINSEKYWLDDYSLYVALRKVHKNVTWSKWDQNLREHDKNALDTFKTANIDTINSLIFQQYFFYKQWNELKMYANKLEIKIIGDIPIYVSYDSVDVWANPSVFQLDKETRLPTAVSGAPADLFSPDGQCWNTPLYDWDGQLKHTNYDWWIKRLKKALELLDIVRIDHFRGFEAYWSIPVDSKTGDPSPPGQGEWIKAHGNELFKAAEKALGPHLPIIAEDLGYLTQEVFDMRDKFHFMGMRVLHCAFVNEVKSKIYLPHNYIKNCCAYTGTHDTDTTKGWFQNASKEEKEKIISYLQRDPTHTKENINWYSIQLILSSVAAIAIIPFQDILGLDSKSRMNDPANGKDETNWTWRFYWDMLTEQMKQRLALLTITYGR